MTTQTIHHSARHGHAFLHIGEFLARINLAGRIARDIRHLEEMSDHQLRDIGLNRGDIALAVRDGRNFDLIGRWRL